MKALDFPLAVLFVAKHEDGSYSLRRGTKEMKLWRVTYNLPIETFVLAEDKEGAISQACERIKRTAEEEMEMFSTVERIPFGISGWSLTQF